MQSPKQKARQKRVQLRKGCQVLRALIRQRLTPTQAAEMIKWACDGHYTQRGQLDRLARVMYTYSLDFREGGKLMAERGIFLYQSDLKHYTGKGRKLIFFVAPRGY